MPNLSLKGLNLSLKEFKVVAKERDIKGYESLSEDKLLRALKVSELLKEKKDQRKA